ncbi:RraA family protein [Pusillimonas sp. TS35]|uniref:RraA family protein n=1 Tax=Paracandidimonas lactea TaxID=2895524 RepID=UPI0013680A2F|nr:RraA family protein [Paracandidimonas lactea]MYN13464.1 RraA family protein [Pusillimonas sp. TS35]
MAIPDIIKDFPRVPADVIDKASAFQPAILADVAGRRGALHGRIKPLSSGMKLSGSAFTVEVRPGDNLMIHAAIALAKPGDVLVIDGKGDLSSALMGTIMMTACRQLGIAGIVIDGAARDSLDIIDMAYPVFAAGTNPNGPTKNIGGRIGHPVTVGGVTVNPGDFVIADNDGVVVVEREKIASLLAAADKKVKDEAARIAAIKAGDAKPKWLSTALRTAGVLKDGEEL